jgi:hypothetical protein
VDTVRYEPPPHLSHDEADAVLEPALTPAETSHASAVLIGLAQFDDDRAFVERWCTRAGRDAADPALRGSAALAAAQLAKRFGTLEPETQAMVRAVAADPAVDGRKHEALAVMERSLRG